MTDTFTSKVRAVLVQVDCPHCKGKMRLPGGPYKKYGEVVNCWVCSGRGTVVANVPLADLARLLSASAPARAPRRKPSLRPKAPRPR